MDSSTASKTASDSLQQSFRQMIDMWHPHVYGTRPKSPTPFSIDDILRRPTLASEAAHHLTRLFPDLTQALAHHMVAAMQQQQEAFLQKIAAANSSSNDGSGRDSIQSTSPPLNGGGGGNSSNNGDAEDDQPQPLNLSLATNKALDELLSDRSSVTAVTSEETNKQQKGTTN
jgi:hypothetical protein